MNEDGSDVKNVITIGDINNAQGIAVGRGTSAIVTGNNVSGVRVDALEMRAALESLYDELGKTTLPKEEARSAQTAAREALEAVSHKEVKVGVVTANVKEIAEIMKAATLVMDEGSSLWNSVKRVIPILGPLVGGAHVVASWFGLSF